MKKLKFYLFFSIFFFFTEVVNACNLKFSNFGSTPESLKLVENNILSLSDFADLSVDELIELIEIDEVSANKLILKARELSGYFTN